MRTRFATRPRRAKATRPRWQRGTMNKGEAKYAAVLEAQKRAGAIADWWFESTSWLLGPVCRYHPDFLVLTNDDELELHEVKANRKGKWFAEEDARVKMKAFVDKYPLRLIIVWPTTGDRTGLLWERESLGE
jgi:hypothetical protein